MSWYRVGVLLCISGVFALHSAQASAAAPIGCSCQATVQAANICEGSMQKTFTFGETLDFSTVAADVLKQECPGGAQASLSELKKYPSAPIAEETCEDFNISASLNGATFVVFYKMDCSLLYLTESSKKGSKEGSKNNPSIELTNPIGETDISTLIGKVMKAALGIIGAVTLFVFVYGGFLWLISAGKSDQVEKGSKAMLYAAIGLCIIFASYAILDTILTGLGGA